MAIVELGPVTTRLVLAVGESVERMKPRNPHKIAFSVLDRANAPDFGPDDEPQIVAKAFRPTERAEHADLRRLRGALYDDRAK